MTVHNLKKESIGSEKIREIDGGVHVEVTGNPENLGLGFLESVSLGPHVRVMIADLTGQPEYEAVIDGYCGLILEMRLEGRSESKEIGGQHRISALNTGEIEIVGIPEQAKWEVKAPAQKSFRTVAVAFSQEWLRANEHIEPAIFDHALNMYNERQLLRQKANPRSVYIAETLLEMKWHEAGAKVNGLGLAVCFLGTCLRNKVLAAERNQELLRSSIPDFAIRLIDDNPATFMTVKKIASACGTSEATLKRLFNNQFGMSIGSYAKQARLKLAKEMLRDGVPIAVAARILGYSRPEALSRVVKQHFGLTPKELINQNTHL